MATVAWTQGVPAGSFLAIREKDGQVEVVCVEGDLDVFLNPPPAIAAAVYRTIARVQVNPDGTLSWVDGSVKKLDVDQPT